MPVSPALRSAYCWSSADSIYPHLHLCPYIIKNRISSLFHFSTQESVLGPWSSASWHTAARPPQLVVKDGDSLQRELKSKMKFTLFKLRVTLSGCVHSVMTAALFLQNFSQLEKSKKKLKNLHPWKNTEMMGEMFQIFFGLNKQFLNN